MPIYDDPFVPDGFARRGGELYVEDVPLGRLAERFGTPLYVYSRGHILRRWQTLVAAFAALRPTICYAVKANDNVALLADLAAHGAGFDVVSGGELARVLAAGAPPAKVVFSGVGKRDDEIAAALAAGVGALNVESAAEAERIAALAAERGARAVVGLRVNPDVDPRTHPYVATGLSAAKFGVPAGDVAALAAKIRALPALDLSALSFHLGSQLLDLDPVLAGLDRVLELVERLRGGGAKLRRLDIGGGIGVRYRAGDREPDLAAFAAAVGRRLAGRDLHLVLEPGRFIVANAGVLLTRVLYRKSMGERRLGVVDAAMNDLLRPALYQAYHEVLPVRGGADAAESWEIVGPVCESADVLARDRRLPLPAGGELLAVLGAGAYGAVMASAYNSRPRPAEVLVDGDRVTVLRARETVAALVARDAARFDWSPA